MRVTRTDAERVAQLLKESPSIAGVELFGSVLRDGEGHDADLVVIVERSIASKWWEESDDDLRIRMGTWLLPLRRFIKRFLPWLDEATTTVRKARRVARASRLCGCDFAATAEGYKPGMSLDIFLMPADWRSAGTLNAASLRGVVGLLRDRETRRFLERVANVAVRIA